jgi:FlaA1/EpsC-like NDP-sugar epimerase
MAVQLSNGNGTANLAGFGAFVLRYRRLIIVGVQMSLVVAANYGAFLLRFDGSIPDWALQTQWRTLPWLLAIRGLTFIPFGLYAGLWRYASIWDLRNIVVAVNAMASSGSS